MMSDSERVLNISRHIPNGQDADRYDLSTPVVEPNEADNSETVFGRISNETIRHI